jgi:ribonucleotide reductase alpha subunit
LVNKQIFETIYHAALECSNQISIDRSADMLRLKKYKDTNVDVFTDTSNISRSYTHDVMADDNETLRRVLPIRAELDIQGDGLMGAYSSFVGSPASKGILQFDMWNVEPSTRYDWSALKESIKNHGLRNSLLLAPMPTASTSQILGNNECFEPFTSNIYSRRTMAGDYVVANKHLMKELVELGLWSESLKDNIIINKGSIQQIDGIPDHIKEKYKIVWEIPMRHMIDMSADRGAFICQSQSLNLWVEEPDYKILTSMHFHSWKKGLKTGIYYLRRKPRHQPQQFTIDPDKVEECEMCSG